MSHDMQFLVAGDDHDEPAMPGYPVFDPRETAE